MARLMLTEKICDSHYCLKGRGMREGAGCRSTVPRLALLGAAVLLGWGGVSWAQSSSDAELQSEVYHHLTDPISIDRFTRQRILADGLPL